ncbi:MAG: carboxypeptidase-like regulatory domain-containing protein [Terracidiphilus sp.]
MAAARIAAVFVALLSIELSAQPAPQGNLTIQVTDPAGVVVPGARVQIDPSPFRHRSVLKTDGRGQAVLAVPAGAYTLVITCPGFKRWTREIDVQSGGSQTVVAKLEIADMGQAGSRRLFGAGHLPRFS